jgi:hypothetical protein
MEKGWHPPTTPPTGWRGENPEKVAERCEKTEHTGTVARRWKAATALTSAMAGKCRGTT